MASNNNDIAEADIVDVLVIGAGPSGAVVTHTAAAPGLSVICLEQGDWVNPSDFPANHPEWELLIQHDWAHDPNVRKLPSDYPVDVSDSDMWPVMFNAVGGSSIYYGAEWPRLLPSDFRVKTLDGVADDWPISYNDLKPYHDEVDAFIGVSGVDGDTGYPEGLDYPLPAAPVGQGRASKPPRRPTSWAGTGGRAPTPSPARSTRPSTNAARWGTCEWGCPQGAKASFDLIYMPQALQARRAGDHRSAGPQDRHRRDRPGHRRRVHRPRRRCARPGGPLSGAVRQRQSAPRGSLLLSASDQHPTAWPTPQDWSAAT